MSLAEYVRDDLAERLRTGRGLPQPLTLDSLADLYQVSFTPVRAAVAELIEDGLLAKGANRRLVSRSEPEPVAAESPAAPLLAPPPQPARDAYAEIVDDLVQQSLQGSEIYLREESTADKYQMSRSAIRNIFHRLAGESILDHIPRRGWRLRPFRRSDLQEFNEAREALELKALDLAWERLDHQHIQILHDANDGTQVDESLHEYIIQRSGNRYIQDFFERHARYYRLLFRWEDQDATVASDTIRQHQQILLAILNQDRETARIALSRHILHNNPLLVRQP